jgi:hypothetical protein
MCAHGPFGVVAGILDTLHGLRFVCRIRLGKFFDGLFVSLRNMRKSLVITRLPGAVRRRFLLVVSKFIDRSLVFPHITSRHKYRPRAPQLFAEQWLLIG